MTLTLWREITVPHLECVNHRLRQHTSQAQTAGISDSDGGNLRFRRRESQIQTAGISDSDGGNLRFRRRESQIQTAGISDLKGEYQGH
jgi:hypothetical protein